MARRFRLGEEGRRRREGAAATPGTPVLSGQGGPGCGSSTAPPRSPGSRGAGAGARSGALGVSAHRSWMGGFASLRVLPAGPAILGLPASHIWPCTSRWRRARTVPDPSNRGGSGESREIPARRTWGAAANTAAIRLPLPPASAATGPALPQPPQLRSGPRRGRARGAHLRSP